ncbi:MAG: hypothetical protein GX432_07015 [Candidatus Atribacteria bacterium]|nr:hypothetical protein [Candidatus Atribacteria bacterium]
MSHLLLFVGLSNCGIGMNEILVMPDRKHRTPQNDKLDGRDCQVVQPKAS